MIKKTKSKDTSATPREDDGIVARKELVQFTREQRRREFEFVLSHFDHFSTKTLLDMDLSREIEACARAEDQNLRLCPEEPIAYIEGAYTDDVPF